MTPWYWVLQVLVPLQFAAFIACTVLIINADFPVDYTRSVPPGQYFSLRYHDLQWVACMMYSFKFLFAFVVYALITFRRSRGCFHVWFVLLILLTLIEAFVFFALIPYYANANKSGARDNKFNDPHWCCRPEIFTNPVNGCPNAGPCSFPVPGLGANADYVWIFWTSLVFLLLDIVMVAFFSGALGIHPYRYSRYSSDEDAEYNTYVTEPPSAPPMYQEDNGLPIKSALLIPTMDGKYTKGE